MVFEWALAFGLSSEMERTTVVFIGASSKINDASSKINDAFL